jgi:hypothetical protein
MAEAGAPDQALDLAGLTAGPLAAALHDTYARRAALGAGLAAAGARQRELAGETARLAVALIGRRRAIDQAALEIARTALPGLGATVEAPARPRRSVLDRLHRVRVAFAPPGSRRERAWRRIHPGSAALAARPAPATVRAQAPDVANVRSADPAAAILARIAKSRGAVVFPPTIGWTVDLVQRPHHLARAFARAGYVAVFDTSNAPAGLDGFREVEPGVFLYAGRYEALGRLGAAILWTFPYNYHLREHHPPA